MRIGIFDPYLDDLGGGEKYMMFIAQCLSKEHEITVFWDNIADVDVIKKRFNISFENINVQKNIFSSKVNLFSKIKDSWNFDAFIILSDGSIPFVYPKKLFLHIQQPLPRRKMTLKDKIKIKLISTIFYNSQYTKQHNNQLFSGVKSEVIYPPVSLGLNGKELKTPEKENIIMHVGRFRVKNMATSDYKKQGFMIDTFKKLVDKGLKNWKFVLASSVKKEDEELFTNLKKSAVGYPVEFRINNTNDELLTIYRKAKIYWHASGYGEDIQKHPELAEHFGMTTVEAMNAGVVPVVINSGGQKEIVTNGENGFLWDTAEELLDETKRLVDDEKLWQELSKHAKLRALDFSEAKFCREIQRIITE